MAAGGATYLLWCSERWAWLETAGLFIIGGGLLAVSAGMFCLVCHFECLHEGPQCSRRRLWLQLTLTTALLLANFPAAVLIVRSAILISQRYTLRVRNESGRAIDNLAITSTKLHNDLGAVPAGKSVSRHFYFQSDGSLDFTARQGNNTLGGQLEGYVTHGMGGVRTLTIIDKGMWESQSNGPWLANEVRKSDRAK
jgi:hypothetical protein